MEPLPYIVWGNKRFQIPDGYVGVGWDDVKEGDEVYIVGTNNGHPWAYGPHWVHDPKRSILVNSKGTLFPEKTSGVLKKHNNRYRIEVLPFEARLWGGMGSDGAYIRVANSGILEKVKYEAIAQLFKDLQDTAMKLEETTKKLEEATVKLKELEEKAGAYAPEGFYVTEDGDGYNVRFDGRVVYSTTYEYRAHAYAEQRNLGRSHDAAVEECLNG